MLRASLTSTRWFATSLTVAIVLSGPVAAAPNGSPEAGGESIPSVSRETVAFRSGLDASTLSLIDASPAQREQIEDVLSSFMERERPRLSTYRAIWAEMRERKRNLAVSAAENAFDPCEFISDEAMESAQAAVREARDRFNAFCATASEPVADMLEPEQYALVRNAAANPLLPAPLRWLELDDEQRRDLLRLVQVHEARRRLAERYPHLRDRFDEANLVRQARQILDADAARELDELLDQLEAADATGLDEARP